MATDVAFTGQWTMDHYINLFRLIYYSSQREKSIGQRTLDTNKISLLTIGNSV